MRKLLILLLLVTICTSVPVCSQTYTRNGNIFSYNNIKNVNNSTKTKFEYADSKGNKYPIYITSNGRCFIIKASAKTNKEYKYYLPEELSKAVAKELNIAYK